MVSEGRHSISEYIVNSEDCRIIPNVHVPDVTLEDIIKFRKICEGNECKNYDTSWTCPPHCGSNEECISKIKGYSYADVYIREFRNVDFKNKEAMEKMMDGFRTECRDILTEMRKDSIDAMAFADGPCRYCGDNCSVKKKKPCPYPEMQVPSVSGYGIDMGKYIESIGESFTFSENKVTLYGIFLFR